MFEGKIIVKVEAMSQPFLFSLFGWTPRTKIVKKRGKRKY